MSGAGTAGAVVGTARMLPFAASRVFAAFGRAELLSRWWGPAGFTNTFQTFEFRPGGRWEFVMHGPDGARYPNASVFRALTRPALVVIEHVVPPHFTLTVTLEPAHDGTVLTWAQAFPDAAVAARVRAVVEPANEENLDRLAAVLADAPPP